MPAQQKTQAFRDHSTQCNIHNHSEIGSDNLFWKIPDFGQGIEK